MGRSFLRNKLQSEIQDNFAICEQNLQLSRMSACMCASSSTTEPTSDTITTASSRTTNVRSKSGRMVSRTKPNRVGISKKTAKENRQEKSVKSSKLNQGR